MRARTQVNRSLKAYTSRQIAIALVNGASAFVVAGHPESLHQLVVRV